MNIIICDDRIDDRKNLSDLLSDYGEKKNYEFAITEYDSGEQTAGFFFDRYSHAQRYVA